jgi:flagellar biogenesis protein FliO
MRLSLLPLIAVLWPVHAHADGEVNFEVIDHGDTVEVIAHGLEAKTTNISPVRSRLEVPLVGNPIANRQMMQDTTVLQVELDGISNRVLSVKTKLERPEVKNLAPLAKAMQVGNDLHLIFPRHANGTPVAAATTIAPPAPKPAVKATPIATPAPVAAAPAPAPVSAPIAVAPAPAPTPLPAAKPSRAIPPEQNRDWSGTGMYAIAAFGALGAAAYFMRKKKKSNEPVSTIDVVAQRGLGGKAKVMWLAAGDHEMIISVTGQQVRMLGQWPRGTTQVRLPTATATTIEAEPDADPDEPIALNALTKPVSPSVAGILKLRERFPRAPTQGRGTTQSHVPTQARAPTMSRAIVNADVATDDADDDLVWAEEILAATQQQSGSRR